MLAAKVRPGVFTLLKGRVGLFLEGLIISHHVFPFGLLMGYSSL